MAIFIPDLFGSYVDGREKAIDSNWKDMQNYNSVLTGQLSNAKTMATFDSDVAEKAGQADSAVAKGAEDLSSAKNSTYLNELMNMILHSGDLGKALALANYQGLYTNAWASPQLTRNSVSQSNDTTRRSSIYTGKYGDFLNAGLEGQQLGNEETKLKIGIYKEHPEYLGGYGWGGYGKPGDMTWTLSDETNSYSPGGSSSLMDAYGNATDMWGHKYHVNTDSEQGNANVNKDENSGQGN